MTRPLTIMLAAAVIGLGAVPMAIWTQNEIWAFGMFALVIFLEVEMPILLATIAGALTFAAIIVWETRHERAVVSPNQRIRERT